MFRLWGKEFKENRLLRDTVICDETTDTRTHKIFNALDAICYEFDLSKPIWLCLLYTSNFLLPNGVYLVSKNSASLSIAVSSGYSIRYSDAFCFAFSQSASFS